MEGTNCLGNTVATPRVETFYWHTIIFSQTFGTALGDWMADTDGLGYGGGALVFGAALLVLAPAYFCTHVSRVLLFWTAFILTRPLGATLGNFLDKPIAHGGFAFSRFTATAILAAAMVALILVIPQRPGVHPGAPAQAAAERPRMAQRSVAALLRIGCLGARAAVPDRGAKVRCDVMNSSASLADYLAPSPPHYPRRRGGALLSSASRGTHEIVDMVRLLYWLYNPDCVAKSVRIRHRIMSASFLMAIDATPANMASRIQRHTI